VVTPTRSTTPGPTSAVFVGINEETWKFLATLSLVRKLPEFDEPLDGMIYAMTVALGLRH